MSKTIKYVLAFLLFVLVLAGTRLLQPTNREERTNLINTDNVFSNFISSGITLNSINSAYAAIEQKVSAVEKAQTRTQRIAGLVDYLTRVHSPIANEHYAALIIDLSEANGVDFRIVVALMGTESGWCKAPIYYNCFGYLNRVKYESFDDAFSRLIPKISAQYWRRYGWDLVGFIQDYGRIPLEYAITYAGNMRAITNKLYY